MTVQPSQPTPTYTARTPEDLVALVPILLGFHPEDSVVLMTFGEPGKAFHARVDLPEGPDEQEIVTDVLMHAVRRHGVELAAVLIYSADEAATRSQARMLLAELAHFGTDVIDVLRVDADRYYSVDLEDVTGETCGDGPRSEDVGGNVFDLSSHRFTAERVLEGKVVHRNREELADTLVGTDPEDAAAVALAATRFADTMLGSAGDDPPAVRSALRAHGRWVQRTVQQHFRDHRALDPASAGRILVLAAVVMTRDVAWSEMTRATAKDSVELWRDLVRRAPEDLVPAAASLLGFAAWLAGDGALAWCGVDRALQVDPDYSLADHLSRILLGAVPPSVWEPVPVHELPLYDDGFWEAS